ncbi:tyrosine-type recombinase/integrase [Mycolicibacterium elephantis]|nr:tyrosine-type recombinase/integrase [Mycolicibacterium elephantis]
MRAEHKAPGTVRTYTAGITAYLRWCAATGRPAVLTAEAARTFIADMLAAGAQPATAHARHKALRRFTAWLTAEGELDADPLAGSRPPRLDTKLVDALTDDQLRALIAACHGKKFVDRRDEAAVRFMAETGSRAAETLDMTVGDVDLARGLAAIRRGKGGKGRTVPFGAQTAAALDRYLRARRQHRLADTSALWLGGGGKTFGYHGLDDALKLRARAAGIDGFHLHRLRHTAATRWLAAGGSEGGLMAVAGWARRDMIDRYTGASAAERAAAEARTLGLGDL